MKLIHANDARKQTLQNIDKIVLNFLKIEDLENTLITRLNRHIEKGELKIEHYTTSFIYQAKENILEVVNKILIQFKNNGYSVNLEDIGNGYWIRLKITIEW
ncbi:hypothetical protein G8V07_12550 [Clostridium botulinum D/C]|uniref:hypothetical protein n=1 Tax=Clostridium botulinum TaxID=1491 RepID=UPI001E477D26|nr:hypothetical protein [Clostridium botulinum]MCD3321139.1 hypothetical protein [Clostridium botulinum D/C]MCD3324579.1 hypothetical protein [Clostridium botulinum D/C]MCD3326855.1 hypothetical protein [Clostridium botulinum D/C]